ncbi:hypothetical protein B9Z55_013275 [Caenorhabditis nigoni]|uniref:Thaumatin-like protein n=1 Tax=Caenorhabditis nigoni TaxID=1611254 RepID=A0A2G5U188_9PELO|nr:hypothetical protein B9Z55_013275 [Caenorhabditis nigoni]
MSSYVLLLFSLFLTLPLAIHTREINIYNKCPFTVWPGILGLGNPAGGGFRLNSGENRSILVNEGWTEGKIWARTDCDGNMRCATGGCGSRVQCNGVGGKPPATVAEFTFLAVRGDDYYQVSMEDGYNIPVLINVTGIRDCKNVGGCSKDINEFCPGELAIKKDGKTVACKSGCLAYNNDRECCRGDFNFPMRCFPSKTAWFFGEACPTAFTYAYDLVNKWYRCDNDNMNEFVVQFC